ncbi:MAG: hypothetical protein QNJ77_13630 [Acidimicrobiia bacterium]|nr:hypothetical protein [Acidimicrobiia bacterium]
MKRGVVVLTVATVALVVTAGAAWAQGVTGGCRATVNGQTPDTLTRTNPLVVSKGDTVDLVGMVPAAAGSGDVPSQTDIYVEVVGDIPVASEAGDGPQWGGTVTVPNVITQLAPGVYKVKGTATGEGWQCTGSAYVKVEGGPLTAAAAVGVLVAAAGVGAVVRSRGPKQGQVFSEAGPAGGGGAGGGGGPEVGARATADVVTIGLFGLLVVLVGSLGPSWVL